VHKEGAAPDAVPTVDVTVNGQKEVPIVDLLASAFGKSKREARPLVSQIGVRVDGTWLLHTSDAADDPLCVVLGGRRAL